MSTTTQTGEKATVVAPRAQRTKIGTVRGDARDKTIKVEIERLVPHAKYLKFRRRMTVLHVHDERNEAKSGDTVEVAFCSPISKTKQWRLVRVLTRGGE